MLHQQLHGTVYRSALRVLPDDRTRHWCHCALAECVGPCQCAVSQPCHCWSVICVADLGLVGPQPAGSDEVSFFYLAGTSSTTTRSSPGPGRTIRIVGTPGTLLQPAAPRGDALRRGASAAKSHRLRSPLRP